MKVAVIIPVCNAAKWLPDFLPALQAQQPAPDSVLFIDSASDDETVSIVRAAGYAIHGIARSDFNHGGTRQLATQLVAADVYVFLTQDALLQPHDALANLTRPFLEDDSIGLTYGRQLPHLNARPLGAHAREFNYPAASLTKSIADAPRMGFKTFFASNSFAAYRRTALQRIGGFPRDVICTEDAHVAARMLIAGWKVHYTADACVRHSHDYSLLQQFRRYFDIGVFYGRERWISEHFGSAGGEGLRFILSEFKYLSKHNAAWLMPYAIAHTVVKVAGYKLGKKEQLLRTDFLKKPLSMNPNFWSRNGVRR